MKIKFKNELNKNKILKDYQSCRLDNAFWVGNEYEISDTYTIIADDVHIGYLTITLKDDNLFIELIELFVEFRRYGYGSEIIKEMYNYFGVSKIAGESLSSAIPFWYNLGAKFYISYDELKYCYNNCGTALFELG